jgi:hypothetical protein
MRRSSLGIVPPAERLGDRAGTVISRRFQRFFA